MTFKTFGEALEELQVLAEHVQQLHALETVVLTVLQERPGFGLAASEITEGLTSLSFPIHEYTDFDASLDFVLKRLFADNKVIIAIKTEWNMRSGELPVEFTYRWGSQFI